MGECCCRVGRFSERDSRLNFDRIPRADGKLCARGGDNKRKKEESLAEPGEAGQSAAPVLPRALAFLLPLKVCDQFELPSFCRFLHGRIYSRVVSRLPLRAVSRAADFGQQMARKRGP